MKVVIGIVLISLVILGLIAYMILMLNAREMIFCGDLKNENGTNAQITRVYTCLLYTSPSPRDCS